LEIGYLAVNVVVVVVVNIDTSERRTSYSSATIETEWERRNGSREEKKKGISYLEVDW
jgi:hypothetical protein